jgi:outer membrane protein TolC
MIRVTLLVLLIAAPSAALAQGTPPTTPLGGEVRLTLHDVTALAVAQNLDLEIARAQPQIAREIEDQAHGAFDPVGFGEYRFDHTEEPFASPVQDVFAGAAVSSVDNDIWTYQSGLAGILPIGINYSSTYLFTRTDSTSAFDALERAYRPRWVSTATLPLLRDLIYNEANVAVKRTDILRRLSDERFRQVLMDTLVGAETAYWNLAARRADEAVAAKSLETARDLLEQVRVQYEVGVVSKVNVSQAMAGEAERDFEHVIRKNFARKAQDDLLDLIARPDLEQYQATRVVTEDPAFVDYEVNEAAAVGRALELRPELAQAQRNVEDAELQLKFARNQRLPRLDVTGGYTLTGLSGPVKEGGTQTVPTGWWSADDEFFNASGNHGWTLGGRVEIPIGNRSASNRVTQREIELRRSLSALKRQEQDIILEVREAARNLRSTIEGLQAAERRRVAQEESLRAEQERLRLGDSTPFQVLEFEEDLAEAERQEIFALQGYRNSITAIERAQGTLLETRGVVFADELQR